MQEVIYIHNPSAQTAATGICAAAVLVCCVMGLRAWVRSRKALYSGAPARAISKARRAAIGSAVMAIVIVLLYCGITTTQGIYAVELGETHLTVRTGWGSQVIPYKAITSIKTEVASHRGTRRSGERTSYRLFFLADGREYKIWVPNNDLAARQRVDHIAKVIRDRNMRTPSPGT